MALPVTLKGATLSWAIVREIGRSLWTNGREQLRTNLSEPERTEFGTLLRRSRGRRSKLPAPESDRLVYLVRKAATGDGQASWAAVLRSVAMLMPPQLLADAWGKLASRGKDAPPVPPAR
jgi:hypothetical protein